jgi:YVTN family beta-propeller protein
MHRPFRCFIFALAIAAMATAAALADDAAIWPKYYPSSGITILPNGWQLTPAGKHIPLPGDFPMTMLVSADGKDLIVNTGGYHDQGLCLIDTQTEKIKEQTKLDKTFYGLCFDGAAKSICVAGAGSGDVINVAWSSGNLGKVSTMALAGKKQPWIAGLSTRKAGGMLVVNLDGDLVYSFANGKLEAEAKTGYRPYSVKESPDGKWVAVSNWGDHSVSFYDEQLKPRGVVKVGSQPNDMAWGKDGRLFVANAGDNSVSVIDGEKVIETIKTSLDPKAPVGSTPNAVVVSPEGRLLYVANADNNNVAMIDIRDKEESKVMGFIPTGWYPSALAISPDGRTLYIGTAKGLQTRANPNGPHVGYTLQGTVSTVDVPNPTTLAGYTRQVRLNCPQPKTESELSAQDRAVLRDSFSKIKHVLYIIRENRTYDQVFGDMKEGNGDKKLCMFGEAVTPNAHALARDYVLLDNIYCNGEVSEDGHQWCDAAYCTNFVEKSWVNGYSQRGRPEGDLRAKESPGGYIWENCGKHKLTWRTYGEAKHSEAGPNAPPEMKADLSIDGHTCKAWNSPGRDPKKAEVFIEELREAEKKGEWYNFMIMSLGEDHTHGLKAGDYSPKAMVGSNDQALGQMVDAISHSKFWAETAIFVIEDDAQNGHDHVDAHRTVGLVISPYTKRHAVDSTMYSTASMVRTIELMLSLPPMTQFDAGATPMYNSFVAKPTLLAYNNGPARTDLDARNPAAGKGAKISEQLNFTDFDQADPDLLNLILWDDFKPGVPMPAPVHSARLLFTNGSFGWSDEGGK